MVTIFILFWIHLFLPFSLKSSQTLTHCKTAIWNGMPIHWGFWMSDTSEVLLQNNITAFFFLFFSTLFGPINVQPSGRDRSNCRIWEKWGEGSAASVMPCLGFLRLSDLDSAEMGPLTQVRQAASPTHAKKIHGLLLILRINKRLCFPGLPGCSCQACCFCKGSHSLGDSLWPCMLWQIS